MSREKSRLKRLPSSHGAEQEEAPPLHRCSLRRPTGRAGREPLLLSRSFKKQTTLKSPPGRLSLAANGQMGLPLLSLAT
eukprot:6205395-Pleurochrysis_carterae.AAC.4